MADAVLSFSIPIASVVRLSRTPKQHNSALIDNLISEAAFTALTPLTDEIRLTDEPKKEISPNYVLI